MPFDLPPGLTALGGLLTVIFGSWMVILAVIDRRSKLSDRRFDEIQVLHELSVADARHARDRLDQVRAERDEWKAKAERGEITIAQLREQLAVCANKERALRAILRRHGITQLDVDNAS